MTTLAFPRYGGVLHADLASEALHGKHGDLAASVHAMAVLFAPIALPRSAISPGCVATTTSSFSTATSPPTPHTARPGCIRMRPGGRAWVGELEYGRLKLPPPQHQILLSVPVELAAARARHRARPSPIEGAMPHERDDALQRRTGAVYAELAAADWGGPWTVVPPGTDPEQLAASLLQ